MCLLVTMHICHDPFPEISPTFMHASRFSLIHHRVHYSLPSPSSVMPHETVVLRPHIVPDRRPCICGPVPHSCRDPLSFHADSHLSFLTVQPCVLMSYEAQRLCLS